LGCWYSVGILTWYITYSNHHRHSKTKTKKGGFPPPLQVFTSRLTFLLARKSGTYRRFSCTHVYL
jgi:hypothetical protein